MGKNSVRPGWEPALQRVKASWSSCAGRHEFGPPASEANVAAAESVLGRRLPEAAKAVYRENDGMALLEGNLIIEPLGSRTPGDLGGLVGMTRNLSEHGWDIPEELLIFASDGAEALFGWWLPAGGEAQNEAPVIMTAEPLERVGLAVVGTTFTGFLRGWTAYHVQVIEAGERALDILDVPAWLRSNDPDDELLYECLTWAASPPLPDPRPDPYERPLPLDQLREMFG